MYSPERFQKNHRDSRSKALSTMQRVGFKWEYHTEKREGYERWGYRSHPNVPWAYPLPNFPMRIFLLQRYRTLYTPAASTSFIYPLIWTLVTSSLKTIMKLIKIQQEPNLLKWTQHRLFRHHDSSWKVVNGASLALLWRTAITALRSMTSPSQFRVTIFFQKLARYRKSFPRPAHPFDSFLMFKSSIHNHRLLHPCHGFWFAEWFKHGTPIMRSETKTKTNQIFEEHSLDIARNRIDTYWYPFINTATLKKNGLCQQNLMSIPQSCVWTSLMKIYIMYLHFFCINQKSWRWLRDLLLRRR